MPQLDFLNDEIKCGAKFSPCRRYRYSLWREWDTSKGSCVFIGLNPSTADESEDDPTIRRCIRFAKDWGYGRLVMINLFAIRATDPEVMKCSKNPIGSDNDMYLNTECTGADLVVAAWGNHGSFLGRDQEIIFALKDIQMMCFKITNQGQPAHPLYQSANSELIEFNR